jgi:hypothetical protein
VLGTGPSFSRDEIRNPRHRHVRQNFPPGVFRPPLGSSFGSMKIGNSGGSSGGSWFCLFVHSYAAQCILPFGRNPRPARVLHDRAQSCMSGHVTENGLEIQCSIRLSYAPTVRKLMNPQGLVYQRLLTLRMILYPRYVPQSVKSSLKCPRHPQFASPIDHS